MSRQGQGLTGRIKRIGHGFARINADKRGKRKRRSF